MSRLIAYVLVVAGAAAMPAHAQAQVYPERIASALRHRAEYQRRDRDDNREEQTERYTKSVRLGSNGELDVENIAGDITVTRGGGSDATIEVIKTARGRSAQDAKDLLSLVQVDIVERPGRADVRTRYPSGDESRRSNRRNVNVSVAFNITAPAGTTIAVKSISGNLKVSDIKGEVTAESISGDIRVTGAGRVSTVKSVSGNVEIADTQLDGALDASSLSGDVVLRKLTARRIDAKSISGNVRIEDASCERVGAQSMSGNVEYSGSLAKNGHYELRSHSGEVRTALSGGSGFEVEATSFSGDVRSDFDITTRGSTGSERRRLRTTLAGTYGDGSATLELTTFSGRIVIGRK